MHAAPDVIERLATMFAEEVRRGESAYWVCVKLSSVLMVLHDYYPLPRDAFEDFLGREEVLRVLAEKYDLKDEVLQLSRSDPRFRSLRPYVDVVARAFEEAARRYRSLAALPTGLGVGTKRGPPEPLWRQAAERVGARTRSGRGGLAKLMEEWRGTRGGVYYYVREGNVLRRIDKYAVSKRVVYESSRGPTVEYDIPLDKVEGKTIYMFDFTNSGYFYAYKFTAEALPRPEEGGTLYYPKLELAQEVTPDELLELTFEVEDRALRGLLEDLKRYHAAMARELSEYSERMGFEIVFVGRAQRTSTLLEDFCRGVVECMVLQSDRARLRCLKKPMAWVHQLWVMKLICEALEVREFVKRPYEERPSWRIEQGKPYPALAARTPYGYYTFWFEYQLHEMAHMVGMFTRERLHVRPDIVVARGLYDSAEDLAKSGGRIDLIVECKDSDFRYWEKELYTQIPAYLDLFKPRALVVASLKPVPEPAKARAASRGIVVVDGLEPHHRARVEEFKRVVRELLL